MIMKFVPLTLLLAVSPWTLADGHIDGKAPLVCANAEISECIPGGTCEAVSAASINASELLKVDFRKKTVGGFGKAASRPAARIDTQQISDGKIYLQGVDSDETSGRGLGWTMVINQDSGRMTLTASSDDVVFTIFGSCAAL